ncbi:hypothetical protein QIS74_04808 [Colletotrichum tabaci]|uniref:ATPase AAA-type core domain-containing protein n=1 Tax=Colletotrichum tabaci TaxID=1209068 RepID=A0AAV9TH79_9PEZI
MPPSESKSYEQNLEMEPIFAQALNSIPSNDGNSTEKGAPVIWINGYPGTGKLTVATAVLSLLGTDRALLVDNHQLIDQVKISRRNPRYWDARKAERQLVFEKYVLSKSQKDKIIMFTDFQTDTNNGADTSIEYLQAAQQAHRPFLPVSLTCQKDENIRRATNPARCVTESGRVLNKLTDGSSLRRLRRLDLFDFDDLAHYEDAKLDGFIIDITDTSADMAARKIVEQLGATFPELAVLSLETHKTSPIDN